MIPIRKRQCRPSRRTCPRGTRDLRAPHGEAAVGGCGEKGVVVVVVVVEVVVVVVVEPGPWKARKA